MAINLIEKYLPVMVEAFSKASVTEPLLKNQTITSQTTNAKKFKYPKSTFDGYKPYNKTGENTNSNFSLEWVEAEFTQDRYAQIYIDAAENEETMDVAFQTALAQVISGAVKEVDAYRFTKMAEGAKVKDETVLTEGNIISIFNKGIQSLLDNESSNVPVILVNNKHYSKVIGSTELQKTLNITSNTGSVDTRLANYNGSPVIFVNSKLMKKTLSLTNGSYFANADTAKDINVIVIDMAAFLASAKIIIERIFAPTEELKVKYGADGITPPGQVGWIIEARVYHDAWDMKGQEGKIYANVEADA